MEKEISVRAIIPEKTALIVSNAVLFCGAIELIRTSSHIDFATIFISLLFFFCFGKLVYSWLRKKNWEITISQDHVLFKSTFGNAKQFSRNDVRWKAVLTPYYQSFRIRLYNCQNGKMIVSVPFDWINVKELLKLRHYGKVSKEEMRYIESLHRTGDS